MIVSAVPYEVVDVVWEDAKRFLEPAINTAKRRYTIDCVKQHIDDQHIALWVAMDDQNNLKATITTRIYDYPELSLPEA